MPKVSRFSLNLLLVGMWISFETSGYPDSQLKKKKYICYKLTYLFSYLYLFTSQQHKCHNKIKYIFLSPIWDWLDAKIK